MNFDPEHIRWVNRPPLRRVQVVSVKPGETIRVIAAGVLVQLLVHWDAQRQATYPCTCPEGDDEHAGHTAPQWRGYLPCVYTNGRQVIMEVTRRAADHCPWLYGDDIVGLWFQFQRPGQAKQAAVYVEHLEHMCRALNVKPYDPVPRLLEMWGWKQAPGQGLNGHEVNGKEGGPQQ